MPKFSVETIDAEDSVLIGTLSTTTHGDGTTLKPGHAGDLRHGSRLVQGRWQSENNDRWGFELHDPADLKVVSSQQTLEVWDGWWAQRAEIVLDESLVWTQRDWVPGDYHCYCSVCMAKINSQAIDNFFDSGRNSACPDCYRRFVAPRSLDFSAIGGPSAST